MCVYVCVYVIFLKMGIFKAGQSDFILINSLNTTTSRVDLDGHMVHSKS